MTIHEIVKELERMSAGSNGHHQVWLEAQLDMLIRRIQKDEDAEAEEMGKAFGHKEPTS